jgi:hypothetical protein
MVEDELLEIRVGWWKCGLDNRREPAFEGGRLGACGAGGDVAASLGRQLVEGSSRLHQKLCDLMTRTLHGAPPLRQLTGS